MRSTLRRREGDEHVIALQPRDLLEVEVRRRSRSRSLESSPKKMRPGWTARQRTHQAGKTAMIGPGRGPRARFHFRVGAEPAAIVAGLPGAPPHGAERGVAVRRLARRAGGVVAVGGLQQREGQIALRRKPFNASASEPWTVARAEARASSEREMPILLSVRQSPVGAKSAATRGVGERCGPEVRAGYMHPHVHAHVSAAAREKLRAAALLVRGAEAGVGTP
jgi:hypothetical protein